MRALGLLDSNGKPLADRIQECSTAPAARGFDASFPRCRTTSRSTEVVEEAGRRIAQPRGARWPDREAPRLRVGDAPERRDVPHAARLDPPDSEDARI